MRMDTETISYVLEGHELQNDVQTMIQVFLANRHYIRTDTVTDAEITVKSEMKEGIASAMLYRRGEKASAWSMEYDEKMLTEKEQKRIIKRTIYELLKAETGIRPQWGLLTGVRPAKLISSLLEEGKTDKECLAFLTEDYLVMPHKAALALKVAEAERKILAGVRAQADVIIDTTAMKPADLQEYMGSRFGAVDKKRDMQITVFSFGFKYGIPIDADMVIDVRFLPNPFYVEEYKHWTGRVPEVAAYIEKSPVTKEFKRKLFNFMGFIVDQFRDRGKTQFTIAIGCTGGMHRSVFVTEKLGAHLKEKHAHVNVEHRDLHRNRIVRDADDK